MRIARAPAIAAQEASNYSPSHVVLLLGSNSKSGGEPDF